MDSCIITFRSVTPAQRGEGLLRREGIDRADAVLEGQREHQRGLRI